MGDSVYPMPFIYELNGPLGTKKYEPNWSSVVDHSSCLVQSFMATDCQQTLVICVQLTLVYWIGGSGIGMGSPCTSTFCDLWLWFGPWWLHPLSDCCWWPLSGWEFMLACFPSERDTWEPVSNWACLRACVHIYPYTVLHACEHLIVKVNIWITEWEKLLSFFIITLCVSCHPNLLERSCAKWGTGIVSRATPQGQGPRLAP